MGEGTDDVAEAVSAQLARTGATLATAESCTGGLIAHMLTAIAGRQPVLTWAASSATPTRPRLELLGVPAELIEAHGAVSPEVAAAMAEGVRARLGADVGLSATGIAGPGGGTPEKPVGLVYLGLATADGRRPVGSTSAPNSPATSSSLRRPRRRSTGCGWCCWERNRRPGLAHQMRFQTLAGLTTTIPGPWAARRVKWPVLKVSRCLIAVAYDSMRPDGRRVPACR